MTKELEDFLNEVGKHVQPKKEKTLFSLGGRGYYENPASDLLAFFLRPDEEHGFKSLFIQAFLNCLNVEFSDLSMDCVTVNREVVTNKRNRIDLVVRAPDWVLLIENKIFHDQVNDFKDYEEYGQSLAQGKRLLMSILSPQGTSVPDKWNPVSYQDFCKALRRGLIEVMFDHAHSKWMVFAREFILHFENELYQPTMNDKEANFVEKHAVQIEEAVLLKFNYRKFLQIFLRDRLESNIKGHIFTTNDEGWATYCYSNQWGRSFLAFFREGQTFKVRVYLIDLTAEQEAQAQRELEEIRWMKSDKEGKWLHWTTVPGFDLRNKAADELCKLGSVLGEIFKSPPEPVNPLAASQTQP